MRVCDIIRLLDQSQLVCIEDDEEVLYCGPVGRLEDEELTSKVFREMYTETYGRYFGHSGITFLV